MDRNDFRTNLRVELYQKWKEQRGKQDYSCTYEVWKTVWEEETLLIFRKDILMARVSCNEIYLSDQIEKVYDFPAALIKLSLV